nr:MAG TPA: holin [Bacteriophage sp.]
MEYTVLNDNIPLVLTGGATVIICLTEMWSILENLNTLDPNGPWKSIGVFLRKKGGEYTGMNINNENDTVDNNVDVKS